MPKFKQRFRVAIALAVLALLAGTAPRATAAPMKCSGEEKTCTAICGTQPPASRSSCITACGARLSFCLKTGCWDNGTQRYCGLNRG